MGFNKRIACIGLSALMSISMVSYGASGSGNQANMSYGDGTFTPLIRDDQLRIACVEFNTLLQGLAQARMQANGMAQQEVINNGMNPYNNFFELKVDSSDKAQSLQSANNDFVRFADHASNSPLYLASRNNPELVNLWYRISLLNALKGIKKDLDQLAQKGA